MTGKGAFEDTALARKAPQQNRVAFGDLSNGALVAESYRTIAMGMKIVCSCFCPVETFEEISLAFCVVLKRS